MQSRIEFQELEAYVIKDAVDKLQRAMAEEGFSPR